MISSSSNAVLAYALPDHLDHPVYADWQRKSGADASTDLTTTTSTGRIADLIALAIENSGTTTFYIIDFKPNSNAGMVGLLRRWIDEYGDDEDSDLDLQLAELRSNRLAFRG